MDMQTGAWSERVSGREPVYMTESGGREVGEQLGIIVFVGLELLATARRPILPFT
jgi:hypothetical protein